VNELLPFVIAGLVSGSVYGLAGIGLVLTYKTSGIFNFAHGALVTVAAYLFYTLYQQDGIAWALSAGICVLALGAGMGLLFELFARRMALTSVALQIAGTVGVVILVEAGATLIYGVDPLQVQVFLPHQSFTLAGVAVTVDQVIIVAIGLVVTAALYVFLRSARLGMSMRAVVDNPSLLSLSQYNTNSIRRCAWIIGCILATLSGVLIVPSLPLTPAQLILLILQAFGAAAVGRFVSLPVTYAGGLAIGVVSSLCTKYVGNSQILSGLPSSIPFIVLFVVLIVAPRGTWRPSAIGRLPAARFVSGASARMQAITALPPLALAAIAPLIVGTHLIVWGSALTFVILFASMALLIRVAGQISLCHVAFAAIGASTFARLAGQHGIPWFLALALASLVVVPVGAILAIPASRLPVLYLGLATLGFGILLQQMFYSTSLMFSPYAAGLSVPRPYIAATDTQYYYLILVFAVVSISLIIVLTRTRLGRVLGGLADSPLALKALGADERITRVLVFCISAFFAGLSGALYAGLLGNVDQTTFDPLASLTYLVLIVIAVGGPLWASIGAAIGFAVIPGYVQSGNVTQYLQVAFGLIAIAVAVGPGQPALPRRLERLRLLRRRPAQASPPPPAPAESADAGRAGADLEIREMSVSFGGIQAVRNLSISAKRGLITGLIGPNGAGKTTTFNVCSGLIKPTAGRVFFDGHDVTSAGMSTRARLGIGRTFQQTELFAAMTVLENVALGSEAPAAGANPWSQVVARRHNLEKNRSVVAEAIDMCGLRDIISVPAHALSTGQRRLVEIARCIAGPVRLLLLDEPSAGLDPAETAQLAEILRRLKTERGLGILLVEHDMELVMNICDYVYVMDFGRLIFAGEPAGVQASEIVQAAYLGEPAEELDSPAEPASAGEQSVGR
jgi:ABC-type branched-subunit amino acid transport system ATPase component/branched-subunit amino acid ABC-type transport system permease component